jgi:serine/threonine-protein kinase
MEHMLAAKEKRAKPENKTQGLTGWLKLKFLGPDKEEGPVDKQFLDDLSDVQKIERYEFIRKLGQGSMGLVYQGRDPYINRDVGIKVSRPAAHFGSTWAEKYREMFFVEAQSAGRLAHPNIVSIYDAGMYKDFCYMTMEYIDGPTLKKFCHRDYLLPISNVVQILFIVAKALDYAHKKGVIHRDIKPSNIMINKAGYVKITDFGIAKVKSEQTAHQGIVGSPSYMSPEQVRDQKVEYKSDIFSLGCVMYELLTAKRAFPGDNHFSIMYKIVREDPKPMSDVRPEIPQILEKIVQKALAKDPNQRYQSCGDLAYDLRVALRGLRGGTVKDGKIADVVDYIHSVPFFESFKKEDLKEILKTSNILKVPRGKTIVVEGEIDDCFYVILSGRAAVQKAHATIARVGRGECFGEMASLSGQVRSASVVAETNCILMKISSTLLDRSSPSIQILFMKTFLMTLIKRLSESLDKARP